jgi:hypothetical protein
MTRVAWWRAWCLWFWRRAIHRSRWHVAPAPGGRWCVMCEHADLDSVPWGESHASLIEASAAGRAEFEPQHPGRFPWRRPEPDCSRD